MDNQHYILNDKHEVVPASLEEWANWFESINNRRVAETTVGDYWVSTVFLGLDHRWSGDGPPIVFETMAFNRSPDKVEDGRAWDELDMARYCTWDEAKAGHQRMVSHAQKSLNEGRWLGNVGGGDD